MRIRWGAAALFAAVLSACGVRPAITTRVTLDFSVDPQLVRVDTTTEFSREAIGTATLRRMDAARDAFEHQTDEWSLRTAAFQPPLERVIIDRRAGKIERFERIATLERKELPRLFGDTPLTVLLTHADGSSELTIIPGSSNRATRAQQEHVMQTLHAWAGDAAEYVDALSHFYRFIDANPLRARPAFELLLGDRRERSTVDEEQAVVERVWAAMDQIDERLDSTDDEPLTLDEQFDLVFNPFPAEIVVRTPRAATAENLFQQADDTFVIRHAGLLDAIESLEGKWISPDPLAASIRRDETSPDDYARMPRHWSELVTASEIEKAVIDRLKPAAVYRVRWNE